MSDQDCINIVGVKRVFETVEVLHDQYKSIEAEKDGIIDWKLKHIRDELYKVYCCRVYDVMEAILSCLCKYEDINELKSIVSNEYSVEDEYKDILNSKKDKVSLKEMLNAYRVMYTHPQVNNIENRITNKTMFEIHVDEEIMDNIYESLKKCIESLIEKVGHEKILELSVKQDKMFTIQMNRLSKKIEIIMAPYAEACKSLAIFLGEVQQNCEKVGMAMLPMIEQINKIKTNIDINKK